jgi:RNA polymerase sigma-70 factor (ECF subfamily)
MDDNDDNVLAERVLEGETGAFSVIVDRHKEKMYYLGLRFFHNNEDAEDFAQDVFLQAFKKLSSFSGEVPFGAWLYRIAFNLAVNKYHFDRVRLTDPGEPADFRANVFEEYTSPEMAMMYEELRNKVSDALTQLPEAYTLVIRMHYYDRLTYGEISEITDIPVNTIKSHISRAKKMIRNILSSYV